MLTQLIKEQIDTNSTLRKKLVSAILLGGNILVPEGQVGRRHVQERSLLHSAFCRRTASSPTPRS